MKTGKKLMPLGGEHNLTQGLERRFLEGPTTSTKQFKETGGCATPNFLEDWLADQFLGFLEVECPSDWWAYCTAETVGGRLETEKLLHREAFQITAENKADRDAMHQDALTSFKQTKFGYSFSKQQGNYPDKWKFHIDTCSCYICTAHSEGIFRKGGQFEAACSNIVGKEVELKTIQWTRYRGGDFFAPRNDADNGTYAFSLLLSKDWSPLWGGNLVFLDDSGQVSDTAPSQPNTFIIYDLSGGKAYHAVTPVIPTLQPSHYSITGWLAVKS